MIKSRKLTLLAALLMGAAFSNCASTRMSDTQSDSLFRQGKYAEAAERLKTGLEKKGEDSKDGLLYMLDAGLAYHAAGMYVESNKYFLRADQLAEIKDYTSLATETATLLVSDNIKQYKTEDSENVLINVYLAMNFAFMNKSEDALVEARRVNRKLYMMVSEGKKKYKQNAFARYLSAILYEANRDWDDAYLDYKAAAEIRPEFAMIGLDLWRMANRLNRSEDRERIEKKYTITDEQKKSQSVLTSKNRPGEIIVIYENGISPKKGAHPDLYSVPKFYPRSNPVSQARIHVHGLDVSEEFVTETAVLEDIEATAIQNLDEKWAGIVAKKIGGVVAKEVVGNVVANKTDSPLLGALLKVALYASDQADTRSWNLLPKDLQIARISVRGGKYTLRPELIGSNVEIPERTVHVNPGQKVFINFRFMP
jgi:hypothetical protein